jgi:glucokinase
VDAAAIAEGLRMGDELCTAVVRNVGVMLARGIAAIENILDPQAIIVGGGVARSFDLLLPIIREELPSLVLAMSERTTDLRPSALGYDAALVGAAAQVFHPY